MVKPRDDYLEEAIKENAERKKTFRNRIMGGVFVGGATIAAALGLGKMMSADGQEHFVPIKDPTAAPKPQPEKIDDAATFGYSDPNENPETPEQRAEREAEEIFEIIRGGEYVHGDAGTEQVVKSTRLGERQGELKEGDIPQYTITGASPQYDDEVGVVHDGGPRPVSPQLEPQDSDNGVVHGGKGVRTWQNDDDMSEVKDYRKQDLQNGSKQAQTDMALQLMKNLKSNDLG